MTINGFIQTDLFKRLSVEIVSWRRRELLVAETGWSKRSFQRGRVEAEIFTFAKLEAINKLMAFKQTFTFCKFFYIFHNAYFMYHECYQTYY